MCIFIKFFNIKIRIRCNKIKNIIFLITKPVFPTYIPSFYKKLVKTMFRCKINITFHIIIICGKRRIITSI